MSEKKKKPEGVESVERALRLLECFDGDTQRLSLADLARASGFYKSTILRIAASLERWNYLDRDDRGLYQLGPAIGRLGQRYQRSFSAQLLLRPLLDELASESGETCTFYVRDGDERICLFRKESPRVIRYPIEEGTRLPMQRGAAARILRAWVPQDNEPMTSEREETLRQRYIVSRGGFDPELAGMAIAIRLPDQSIGALTLLGPIERYTEARCEELYAIAERLCRKIGIDLPADPKTPQ